MKNLENIVDLDPTPFASGATSKVYKGTLKKDRYGLKKSSFVAVKVLDRDMLINPTEQTRVRNEYNIGKKFNHDNLVHIFELLEPASDEESYAIVMELVEGDRLSRINVDDAISTEHRIQIGKGILSAIQLLHENDILHRDLKADNIIVDKKLRPKVVDYGVSRILSNATVTPANQFLGTLRFASPQAIIGNPMTKKDDIYSLGAVLFELFARSQLFSEIENKALLVDAIRDKIPEVLGFTEDSGEFPYYIRLLVHMMLSKNSDHRPPIEAIVEWFSDRKSNSYINELESFHAQHSDGNSLIVIAEEAGYVGKCSKCHEKNFLMLDLQLESDRTVWKALKRYRNFFAKFYCNNCEQERSGEIRHLEFNPLEKTFASINFYGDNW